MRLAKLVQLHKTVIHDAPWDCQDEYAAGVKRLLGNREELTVVDHRKLEQSMLRREERAIKAYPYDLLKYVCSDCFSSPDAEA